MYRPSRNTEDIDLLRSLAAVIKAIKSNFKTLIIFVIAGAAASILYYSAYLHNRYENQMLVQMNVWVESLDDQLSSNFELLITDKNYSELSRILQMSEEDARALVEIKIKKVAPNIYQIKATTRDNRIFPMLQTGLIRHISDNEYIKVHTEQKKKYLLEMVQFIDTQLEDLNKRKTEIYRASSSDLNNKDESSFSYVLFDPMTIYTSIIKIEQEKLDYQNQLETTNKVQLIGGFVDLQKTNITAVRLISLTFIGMLAGGVLWGVYLGCVFFNKEYLSEKP